MLSLNELREELLGVVPKNVVLEFLGKNVTCLFVGENLAYALENAGEFVVRLDDCNVWESESDNYDLRGQLKYILERYKTRLLDLCVNVCYTVYISYR